MATQTSNSRSGLSRFHSASPSSSGSSATGELFDSILELGSNMPNSHMSPIRKTDKRAVWISALLSVVALFLVIQGKLQGGPAVSVLLLVIAVGITLIKSSARLGNRY